MSSQFLDRLNPEQREAALHFNGPLLVLAGAGSGKTTVLVSRTGLLIEQGIARPQDICVLTFTNKAARELKHRVADRLNLPGPALTAGTFHSFGLRLLKEFSSHTHLPKRFGILDSTDAQAVAREQLRSFNHSGKVSWRYDVILSYVSRLRERQLVFDDQTLDTNPPELPDDPYAEAAEWLLPRYMKRLIELGVVDFDSLLLLPVEMLKKNPGVRAEIQNRIRYLMVDEFQDTNAVQMRFLELITNDEKNIAVVGDDDQSIYGWRGACIRNILDFPQKYRGCKVVRLERNYRSTSSILQLANTVITRNSDRHKKNLVAESKKKNAPVPEVLVFETDDEECEGVLREVLRLKKEQVPYREMAIIYRSNSQGALVELELKKAQIPYCITGGMAFSDHKEVKDLLAYLRCAVSPNEVAFRRAVTTPSRGVGGVTLDGVFENLNRNKIGLHSFMHSRTNAQFFESPSGEDAHASKARAAISEFVNQIGELRIALQKSEDWHGVLMRFLEKVGYKSYLEHLHKDVSSFQKRWALTETFCQIFDKSGRKNGRSLDTIAQFIEFLELRDDGDEGGSPTEVQNDEVQLLTLHASKGLEFRAVILIGVEEDLLPHKTLGTDISEERRLFYVGITRAKEQLILTHCRTRRRYGRLRPVARSRFLQDLPGEMLKVWEGGFRPVSGDERKNLVANFLSQLNEKILVQET